jgi:hypothetical protein
MSQLVKTIVKKVTIGAPVRSVVQRFDPIWKTIRIAGDSDLVAETYQDILTVEAGKNITLNTDTITKTLRITSEFDSAEVLALIQPLIDSSVAALVDGAPDWLNTLNEIAQSINDDSGVYGTLVNMINSNENIANAIDDDLTTTIPDQIVDTFNKNNFRTSKYIIQIEHDSDNKYQSSEILLTHNNSEVYITEFALVSTDSSLGDFSAEMSGNNINLLFSPAYTNTSVKAKRLIIDA